MQRRGGCVPSAARFGYWRMSSVVVFRGLYIGATRDAIYLVIGTMLGEMGWAAMF